MIINMIFTRAVYVARTSQHLVPTYMHRAYLAPEPPAPTLSRATTLGAATCYQRDAPFRVVIGS